jgi:hypothetical protein
VANTAFDTSHVTTNTSHIMSAPGEESASSEASGKKRKGGQHLDEIKSKLTKIKLPSHEKKSVLEVRLHLAEEIVEIDANKTAGEHWSVQEVTTLADFLPGSDPELWEPSLLAFVYPILNRRSCPYKPSMPAELARKVDDIFVWHRIKFSQTADKPRQTLCVTADELIPLMTILSGKPTEEWGDQEVALLRSDFSQISTIDGKLSSPAAIDMYLAFLKDLTAFYIRRPDIRVQLEPDVVIFDVSNVDINVYKQELARYAAMMPPHHGVFPEPWGANAPGLVFPMPSFASAAHLVGFMRGAVPNLRAVVLPEYAGVGLEF